MPGHIRDTALAAFSAYAETEPGATLPLVPYEIDYRERLIGIPEACRLVWNCTDIMPGSEFGELQACLHAPALSRTYAAAARALLRALREDDLVDVEGDTARRRLYDARDAPWRELEGALLKTTSGHNPADRGDRFLARGHARHVAEQIIEQWREGRRRGLEPSLQPLVVRVIRGRRRRRQSGHPAVKYSLNRAITARSIGTSPATA